MVDIKEKSLKKGRYRIIMMSCGYVESNKTAWLIFTTMDESERFPTAAQAVMELALDLHAKFKDECLSPRALYAKCCQEAQADKKNLYCSQCGTLLGQKVFDPITFMEYVSSLHATDCDSFGESEQAAGRDFAFWPWRAEQIIGASKDEVVYIGENAERVILDALYETREDLRKLEYDGDYEPDEEWRCGDWLEVRKNGTNHSI